MRKSRELHQFGFPAFLPDRFQPVLAGARQPLAERLLLLASYVFYGWVHPWYAVMLGASTLADYVTRARHAVTMRAKQRLLWLSLLLNLGVLAFFKYFNFFSAPRP